MKQRAAVHREEARQRNREYVMGIKDDAACTDCGIGYPHYVMQFDHLGEDKDRAVATLAGAPVSLDRLKAEIAKCGLVCANCHAERTHQRRLHLVAEAGLEPATSGLWAQ
jgi:hypothetical protein